MSDAGCRQWRSALGARALGLHDPGPGVGLDGHLDGCGECRGELDDLRAVASTLSLADVRRVGRGPTGPDLEDRVVARIAAEAGHARRRRWAQVAAAGAAAVLVVFAVLVATNGGDSHGREVVLAGDGRTQGTAAIAGHPWGTEITLRVSGLDRGEVYWLWLSDAGGERTGAGTLTGTDGEARAVLGSALPLEDARRIWITAEDDEVVLDARI